MTTDEAYNIILYACSKNKQNGYVSPDDFNRIIKVGTIQYQSYLLGNFPQYTPGRPVARVELGQNSVVRQRLAPVIYGYNLNIDINGFSPYPGDYLQTDAMWSIYGYQRIRFADQHKFASIYNSVIDPVRTNPIYVLEDAGFRFFPQSTATAKLHYVKDAPAINWAYTLDVYNRPVYDPINSIQPVFDDLAMFDIICRSLVLVGVNLQLSVVMQYGKDIQNNGQ